MCLFSTPKIIDRLCFFACYLLCPAKFEEALIREVIGQGVGCRDDEAPSRGDELGVIFGYLSFLFVVQTGHMVNRCAGT